MYNYSHSLLCSMISVNKRTIQDLFKIYLDKINRSILLIYGDFNQVIKLYFKSNSTQFKLQSY